MARTAAKIVADISAFQPIHGDWRPLDGLFAELWATDEAGRHLLDLLAVLERFPEEDGAGVLWSVVHGVESLPGYEPELVRSIRRQPSELGVIMVGRLLNVGISQVGNVSLIGLLRDVAASPTAPQHVRELAADWAEG